MNVYLFRTRCCCRSRQHRACFPPLFTWHRPSAKMTMKCALNDNHANARVHRTAHGPQATFLRTDYHLLSLQPCSTRGGRPRRRWTPAWSSAVAGTYRTSRSYHRHHGRCSARRTHPSGLTLPRIHGRGWANPSTHPHGLFVRGVPGAMLYVSLCLSLHGWWQQRRRVRHRVDRPVLQADAARPSGPRGAAVP